ncbi:MULTISPECIES: DUF305 domain-containing protein [unclassified Saccharopolyspora]|uniref:DUF305 domain-containing protein n=1 Tax=Saccharopolyspora TaxID=1835 RepID=UPI00190C2CFF|nr:DUF305 domain-containing protein [Saccharopolyspora sp. HNM0986]MBK0869974.1 DUF305 domain-containing protein [Saccharopolyspora sp. HNM0986]
MHRSTIIGALLTCGLALGGCAGEQPGPPPPAPGDAAGATSPEDEAAEDDPAADDAEHTATDRDFAQQLRTHHQQVLDVAAMARSNGAGPALTGFAEQVSRQRQVELGELDTWLSATQGRQSGSAPEDSGGPHSRLPGELSPELLQRLRDSQGPEFERSFTEAMGGLYDGAAQIAQAELDEGSAAQMRSLAEDLLARHDAELAQLNAL